MNIVKNRNRTKGHNYEREWARTYRELGFSKAKTSRQASRLLDDCLVDLAFVPFNHQCKAGYRKGLAYSNIFRDMRTKLADNFPEDDPIQKRPLLISHKKGRKPEEHLIVLEYNGFMNMLNLLCKNELL